MLGDLFLQERKERKRVIAEGVQTILNHTYSAVIEELDEQLLEDWLEEIVSEGICAPNRCIYIQTDGESVTIGKTDDLSTIDKKPICILPGNTLDMKTLHLTYSKNVITFSVTVKAVVRNMLALYHMEHDDD
jgi:hypothetical protein